MAPQLELIIRKISHGEKYGIFSPGSHSLEYREGLEMAIITHHTKCEEALGKSIKNRGLVRCHVGEYVELLGDSMEITHAHTHTPLVPMRFCAPSPCRCPSVPFILSFNKQVNMSVPLNCVNHSFKLIQP